MTGRISQQQLESYLWGAAVLLRGTIDAGDYKQFIFPLLFYKRLCDVFDEETQTALKESGGDADFADYRENHRFQIPREAHWREIRQVAKNLGRAIQNGMRAIESANQEKLYGIFGDTHWTNKDRLSDAMLRDLIEHFSALDLTIANLPEDELGQGYEYLIKKFADDSGHTAAEFYTNRTVVHLMAEMLEPQPGESIYDPTCGSGGMLLSCIAHLRRRGQEWRNVRLYGQERNLMTSSIARMNCFLHGIEDFQIVRGDTLSDPKFVEGDRLKRFDLVLANPPYSIKQWDRDAFSSDPWGRNLYGTPPQGRADYVFWQHILCSLAPKTGRCAILFPHGVLFRQEESEMRQKLIEADLIDCVLGLGPNLFYNSPMEACIVICRSSKPRARKGKILFVNAVNEVTRERAQSFLTGEHIGRIASAYRTFHDEPAFSRVATIANVRSRNHSLAIPLYIDTAAGNGHARPAEPSSVAVALSGYLDSRRRAEAAFAKILPRPVASNGISRLEPASAFPLLSDRTGWTRVRFGEVVENINETESDLAAAGLARFVGLEHLEPGSLHVRTWGNISDGTTFTRRCRPGQVLFGKRRAYQRKVAVAEFDAVVSGDIYVLQPKYGRLVPELLPFVCLSERFFEHAVGTSAGSLSPRTNWSSLADFEFALPPLDQQRRIAEILSSFDSLTTATLDLADELGNLYSATAEESLGGRCQKRQDKPDWPLRPVHELCERVSVGIVVTPAKYYEPAGIPCFRSANVRRGYVNDTDWVFISEASNRLHSKSILRAGDVLVVRSGVYAGMSCVVPEKLDGANCIDVVFATPRPELVDADWLSLFINSQMGQAAIKRGERGLAQKHFGVDAMNNLLVPVPAVSDQKDLLHNLKELATVQAAAKRRSELLRQASTSIVEMLVVAY